MSHLQDGTGVHLPKAASSGLHDGAIVGDWKHDNSVLTSAHSKSSTAEIGA